MSKIKTFKAGLLILSLCLLRPFLVSADLGVKVAQSENDLSEKFCPLWKIGDFVVTDGQYLLLIGGSRRPLLTQMGYPAPDALGGILGFVPAAGKLQSTMNVGAPQVRIKNKTVSVAYNSVSPGPKNPADGSVTIECQGAYEKADWGKAEIKTSYQIFPGQGKIVLSSVIKNTGTSDCKDLSYSLFFNADNMYSFTPYSRTSYPQLNFRVYPRKGHYLGWLNPNPVEENEKKYPGKLGPGETFKVQYTLFVETRAEDLLRAIYQDLKVKTQKATLAFKDVGGRFMEVVVRELYTSAIFFRTFLEEPFALDIPLPEGNYTVRANFFPAVREKALAVKKDAENLCLIDNAASGTVQVKIKNGKGEYVPGKISFIGLDPTRTPYFRPENPRDTGRAFEAVKNSVYPTESGTDVKLPVGIYLVTASRGPEYTRDERVVEILKDITQEFVLTIDKVVETPNLLSVDPHMHTQNSDGQILVPERLKSVVGEGLDVAIATDHNYVTDYAGALKKLGLNKYLAVILGNEVTKDGRLHYNTYPMKLVDGEVRKGAIGVAPDEVSDLFNASRAGNPQAILQVNHPRDGNLGYFNNYHLDAETAAFADKGFDLSFNLFEAMNGPTLSRGNRDAIEDWLHLLNRGYFFPLIGSSDSHAIDGWEPGFSRTYVLYDGGKGDALDTGALFQALRKGRSFITNGPLVDFKVNAAAVPGDTLTAKDGRVELSVKVTGAPWISVDEVRLIVNGERKIVFPVKAAEKAQEKFRQVLGIVLDRDAALVIEVLGNETLYPVVQRQTADGLPVNAARPYALTNPIFIDVDGNGKFDPVRPEQIKVITGVREIK